MSALSSDFKIFFFFRTVLRAIWSRIQIRPCPISLVTVIFKNHAFYFRLQLMEKADVRSSFETTFVTLQTHSPRISVNGNTT